VPNGGGIREKVLEGAMDETLASAIEVDLLYELKYLLCAATEWEAQRVLVGKPPKMEEPCHHLMVYSMDSAFAHARGLYEFFTTPEKTVLRNEEKNFNRLTWHDYSPNAIQRSNPYDAFRVPLHGRVMHVCKDRSGYDEIKNEVVTLAADILDVWDRFSKHPDLKDYAALLHATRKRAIKEAENVANQYAGFKCPFSEANP
jgi:hypothetical protein